MAGPSALWVEAMMWAGSKGAHHSVSGLWAGNAGLLGNMSIDVTANTHDVEVDGLPAFGVRLTSPTHIMVCIFTPSGGVIAPAEPGDEDRLIAFFAGLNAAADAQEGVA